MVYKDLTLKNCCVHNCNLFIGYSYRSLRQLVVSGFLVCNITVIDLYDDCLNIKIKICISKTLCNNIYKLKFIIILRRGLR